MQYYAIVEENDSRVVHALCELAGVVLMAIVVDHQTGGLVREQLRVAWRWFRRRFPTVPMLADTLAGAPVTISEVEEHLRGA